MNEKRYFEPYEQAADHEWESLPQDESWAAGLGQAAQWETLTAEIEQESQWRIAFVGLPGAGKRTLLNRLRGWLVTEPAARWEVVPNFHVATYGLFVLVDLPQEDASSEDMLSLLGAPELIVYLIDGTKGVQAADFRWIGLLRGSGRPFLLLLNKQDQIPDLPAALQEAKTRLGMRLLTISAREGTNVESQLLPAMLDAAPRLAIPLGRELAAVRELAARRLTRQTATTAVLVGAQPLPFVDWPMQILLQVGLVLRIGAMFGYAPSSSLSREAVAGLIIAVGGRSLAGRAAKLVPLLGWLFSGATSGAATLALGEAAMRYYTAGGSQRLDDLLAEAWQQVRHQMPQQAKQEVRRWGRRLADGAGRPFRRLRPRSGQLSSVIETIEVRDGQA